MIHQASKQIADFLLSNGIIEEHETDIYVYGYEAFISGVIDICIALIIGVMFKNTINTIIFLIEFISVRIYTGGYHAKTYIKCKLMFSMIVISVMILQRFDLPLVFSILVVLGFVLTVFIFAPIENKNKPLDNEQKAKYCKISRMLSIVWSVAAVLTYFYFRSISNTIVCTLFFIVLLMAAEIPRKEVLSDEENR